MSVGLNRSLQGAEDCVGVPYIEGIVFRTEGIVEAKSARMMGPARGAEPDLAEDWLWFGRLRHGFSTEFGVETRLRLARTERFGYAVLAWIACAILRPRAWGRSGQ